MRWLLLFKLIVQFKLIINNKIRKKEFIMANTSSNFKSEYFGENGTSVANQCLIQKWSLNTIKTIIANSFNFIPNTDCSIIINGSDPIPFKSGREFIIDVGVNLIQLPIYEFKIVEADITYWCMGIFKN